MGYTKHDYQSNDILYAADLAEMDNQIYKNEQDIIKLEQDKQPAGNYANAEEVSQLRSDLTNRSNAIIQTASGESIVTNDSIDDSLRGLRVFGKTKQFSTSGKNLLVVTATSTTVSGVTFNVNADKSITVNGTATGEITYNISVLLRLTIGESYCLSGCPSGGSDTTYRMNAVNPDTWSGNIFDTGTGTTFPAQYSDYNIRIQIKTGVTLSNLTFKPMIRLASIADGTYEPYTGGIPSPNPQYPQELVSVGDDGDIEVGVYGKNLFDKNNTRYVRGIACESQNMHFYSNNIDSTRMYYMDAEPNTSYFISKTVGVNLRVCTCPEIPSSNGSITSINANTSENSCVITTGNEDKYIAFYLLWTAEIDSGITYKSVMDTLMVAKGNTYVPYEPYHKQTLTALTPNGLPGIKLGTIIPDVIANSAIHMSGVYWNEDDDQYYIADTIDFERGVYVKRILELVFDGSADEGWNATSTNATSTSGKYRNRARMTTGIVVVPNAISLIADIVSTHFSAISANTDGTFGCHRGIALDSDWLYVYDDAYNTNDIKLWTDYLSSNPMTVQFILATPIETPLSEEELTAYRALHTNYPVTTILNDSDAHMEVKYNADTKSYIDNKFTELTNAILSMGGNV